MKSKGKQNKTPNRHIYTDLGSFLKKARMGSYGPRTLRHSISQIAHQLGVTTGFIYQVEKGIRKPKDGDFGRWASVYGVRYEDMWKCLDKIPMNLVASLKADEQPFPDDLFNQLTKVEKSELLPFLKYIKWKITQQKSEGTKYSDKLKI
jgi:transcriptional regulator with XRE-family HTH domain